MRYLVLFITALLFIAFPAAAADVLILQGNHSQIMDQMTRLLQNDCTASNRTLVLSDYAEIDLARLVREERPSVVVAIGDQALAKAKTLQVVPVVYGMVLNTVEESLADNVSGVSMIVSPVSYMKLFSALKFRRIAVIYDIKRTGAFIFRARDEAERMGIELVLLDIRSPKEVQQKLADLSRWQLDALWLLPDTTAITPETVDSYFIFAQENNLPVIGFSPAYLSKGALASLELTHQELGKQLCEKIMMSRTGNSSGTTYSPKGNLFFNNVVAEKLGIRISPAFDFFPAGSSGG